MTSQKENMISSNKLKQLGQVNCTVRQWKWFSCCKSVLSAKYTHWCGEIDNSWFSSRDKYIFSTLELCPSYCAHQTKMPIYLIFYCKTPGIQCWYNWNVLNFARDTKRLCQKSGWKINLSSDSTSFYNQTGFSNHCRKWILLNDNWQL